MKSKFIQLFGKDPIFLAPMVGITNLPFRLFCRELGASAGITEFVSVLSLFYNLKNRVNKKDNLHWLLKTAPDEKPVGLQVFGFDSDHFLNLSNLLDIKKLGFDFWELNVGCPVNKICNSGAGAKLLIPERLPILEKIIKTALKAIPDIPFSIKIRAGYDNYIDIKKFSEMVNSFDLLMVTIHPRLAIKPINNQIDHNITKSLVELCDHPVIANGGITSLSNGRQIKNFTKASGIMIGRAARRYPWIFSSKYQNSIDVNDYIYQIEHLLKLNQKFGYANLSIIREQLLQIIKGFPGSSAIRSTLTSKVQNFEDFLDLIKDINNKLINSNTKSILNTYSSN